MNRKLILAALAALPLLAQTTTETNKPETPFPPHKIIGNVFYVGSLEFASYLITTTQGHMLINSTYTYSIPRLKSSVEKLGFKFSDIKILLTTEGHADHIGGCADFIKLTGAKLYVMDGDANVVQNGGKGDFFYNIAWTPCKVDRVLQDNEKITLGDVTLTARLTPGHTKGATTFLTTVEENGKSYQVAFLASPNPGRDYALFNNKQYPNILADFRKTYDLLNTLKPDVWLGAHGSHHGMPAKFARIGKGPNPYIDPKGYQIYLQRSEDSILRMIDHQKRNPSQREPLL